MSENDQKIRDFKNCTGIDSTERAEQYLIDADWDLIEAIKSVTPDETQKLPSEVITQDVPMEDVSNRPSVSNVVCANDSFFSAPSTSNSRIKFNIYNEDLDCSHSIVLSDNETVGRLKEIIQQKWGIVPCQQYIRSLVGVHSACDNELLKNLNLPPIVELSVHTGEAHKEVKKTVNGISDNSFLNDDGKYMLHIFDEDHSKEYSIQYSASRKVSDIKTDMYHNSDIPVSHQIWAGWPSSCTSDDMTLGQLELTKPVHDLSFRSTPVLMSNSRRKRSSRMSLRDSDSETSYSSNEDEDMQSVTADDLFEEDMPSKNCISSLVPPNFENERMGCIQFILSFQDLYGAVHPDFYPGTLDQAFKEACFKPAKDRKMLAVYLHHNESILTNVFCSQLLCDESVLQFLSQHFIIWGWDVTLDNNKSFLLHTMQTVLGREASDTVRNLKTNRYPVILIITRVRRNTEILAVIYGNVGANEFMSQLIQVVDVFNDQQVIESKEEEQRAAREMIKIEQDEAYQQSLEVDRAKLEAKRKQEQLEIEEQAKIEHARIEKAEKKEAHRRLLESKLPPEPEDGVQGITRIRVRVQENQFLERKFLKTDPIELLLDFLVIKGYDISEYNLITNFPRRDLSTLNKASTFEELKLFPQETLILEER